MNFPKVATYLDRLSTQNMIACQLAKHYSAIFEKRFMHLRVYILTPQLILDIQNFAASNF